MATVTADLRNAKAWVTVTPTLMAWEKTRAHRKHRRAWKLYLTQVTRTGMQDEATEINLDRPRLTAYDIS